MRQMPYDMAGDPDLAEAWAATAADRDDMWITAIDDPYLPVHYPTINLLPFLQGDERWVSAGICQTAQTEDFRCSANCSRRQLPRSIGASWRSPAAGSATASGRCVSSATTGADPDLHLRTPEACAADRALIEPLRAGDHAAVIDGMPEYAQHSPEGRFGHYLTMVGALGGRACTLEATQFGEYESVAGTGQAHLWFDVAVAQ